MTKVEVAYSEGPHEETVPVYAKKKVEITGKAGQPSRKVVITVQNYCPSYIQASVYCECNYFSKEKLGQDTPAEKGARVDNLVDFSLWQLERSGIEPTSELEAEIRSTILDGIANFERLRSPPPQIKKSGYVQKAASYLKNLF